MTQGTSLEQLARQLLNGELTLDDFVRCASAGALTASEPVTLDLDRQRRCGFPEVVFGQGKSVETLAEIFHCLLASGTHVLATRVSAEKAARLTDQFTSASDQLRLAKN